MGAETRWGMVEAGSMNLGQLVARVREDPSLWADIELAAADLWATVAAVRAVQESSEP